MTRRPRTAVKSSPAHCNYGDLHFHLRALPADTSGPLISHTPREATLSCWTQDLPSSKLLQEGDKKALAGLMLLRYQAN